MAPQSTRPISAQRQKNQIPISYSSMLNSIVSSVNNQREAGISLYMFLTGLSVCLFLNSSSFFFSLLTILFHATLVFLILYELDSIRSYLPILDKAIIFLKQYFGKLFSVLSGMGEAYQAVAKRAYCLGILVGIGKFLFHYSKTWNNFGVWMGVLAFFHWSEYRKFEYSLKSVI